MNAPSHITEILEKGRSFLLTSHKDPDSDALGSMLALAELLESRGKSVSLHCTGGVPSFLNFLPGSEKISGGIPSGAEFDALVVLDCPHPSRAGEDFEKYAASSSAPLVIIDHHEPKEVEGAVKWADPSAPATGILVHAIFKSFSAPFTKQSATCVYAAISGDTGSFRFSNTTSECFDIVSEMVLAGASPQEVSSEIFENQTRERLTLLGRVLETLTTDDTGKVAWVRIDRETFESTRTSREDSEGMVDIPMSLKGVRIAMLFRQETAKGKTFWKASIRSRGNTDVAKVASVFGGGGHKNAAGFTFEGDFDKQIGRVLDEINAA